MIQSTCAGGDGGITVRSTKPGNAAMMLPVSACHATKASVASGFTLVWTTIVTAPLPLAEDSMLVILTILTL